jgi:hypothetical protein
MGIILFIASLILTVIAAPVGLIYDIVKLCIGVNLKGFYKRINSLFMTMAVSVDQFGNVVMSEMFNDILIYPTGYKFGKEDETISSVLGKNKLKNTLTETGSWLANFLDKLDPNHSINSIEADE